MSKKSIASFNKAVLSANQRLYKSMGGVTVLVGQKNSLIFVTRYDFTSQSGARPDIAHFITAYGISNTQNVVVSGQLGDMPDKEYMDKIHQLCRSGIGRMCIELVPCSDQSAAVCISSPVRTRDGKLFGLITTTASAALEPYLPGRIVIRDDPKKAGYTACSITHLDNVPAIQVAINPNYLREAEWVRLYNAIFNLTEKEVELFRNNGVIIVSA